MIKIILLVLFSEMLVAAGQILFKKSINTIERYSLRGAGFKIRFLGEVISKPGIWGGLFFMVIGLVVWLFALAQGELSLVFSLGSIQYILILVLAHIYLNEKIDKVKLVGTLLVIAGIVLIAIG